MKKLIAIIALTLGLLGTGALPASAAGPVPPDYLPGTKCVTTIERGVFLTTRVTTCSLYGQTWVQSTRIVGAHLYGFRTR